MRLGRLYENMNVNPVRRAQARIKEIEISRSLKYS